MSNRYEAYYRAAYDEAGLLKYHEGSVLEGDDPRYTELRGVTRAWLQRTGVADRADARVLELGCGLAHLRDVHPGWIGLEFSETAVSRVKQVLPELAIACGDMQAIPLPDGYAHAVFSWAAIEHVPRPERVMAEVERVLAPCGVAILAPAWNCRAWTVKRLQLRRYVDLSLVERVEKASIPLRNSVAWRAAFALPSRAVREARARLVRGPIKFDYRPLYPDFSLDLPHISDDDAQASMDAHAAIMYFASRGWAVISHPTLSARLRCRAEPVVVRKPG
jgi:SAM-dependent methyltransferase